MMRRIYLSLVALALAATLPGLAAASEQQDAAAAQRIAVVLRQSGKMRDYGIGVKYSQGTVWLNGRVTSRQQADAAISVVKRIQGVKNIVNNLKVDSSSALRQPGSQVRLAGAFTRQGSVEGATAGYMPLPAEGEGVRGEMVSHGGRPLPMVAGGAGPGMAPATYDEPHMPNHAWPSYAAYPNYAAVTYPKQYSPTAWPFIGPFHPYPQVPLGWRRVSLEWDDGWWFLDFDDRGIQ